MNPQIPKRISADFRECCAPQGGDMDHAIPWRGSLGSRYQGTRNPW